MKAKTTQKALVDGLTKVSKAVNSKSNQTILGCVLIEAEEGVKLTGNNLEIGIQTIVEGEAEGDESIAVDAKMLLDMVKKMPDGDITLETEDEKLSIEGGKAKFSIVYRNGKEFPSIPDVGDSIHFALDGSTFKDMVKQIAFAAAENSSQKAMEGVYIVLSDGIMTMTALDGHRIAVRNAVVDESKDVNAIVPVKTMRETAGIVDDSKLDCYMTDKFLMILFGGTTIISRLIEGKYFDMSTILNSEFATKITIDRKTLYDCCDRALLFVNDGTKKPLVADVSGNSINFRILSPHGSMNEDIDAVVEGGGFKIGFNPKFMLDALAAIEDSEVTVYMNNTRSPILMRDNENSYTYLVLPVNIAEG